jgi:hypothetical protein
MRLANRPFHNVASGPCCSLVQRSARRRRLGLGLGLVVAEPPRRFGVDHGRTIQAEPSGESSVPAIFAFTIVVTMDSMAACMSSRLASSSGTTSPGRASALPAVGPGRGRDGKRRRQGRSSSCCARHSRFDDILTHAAGGECP